MGYARSLRRLTASLSYVPDVWVIAMPTSARFSFTPAHWKGTAVAQWLRYCATNRKVTGSIPDSVIGIFH
jgi:hypothetical protein